MLELRGNLREAAQQINYLKEAVSADHKGISAQQQQQLQQQQGPTNPLNSPLNSTMASFNNNYLSSTLNLEPNLIASASLQGDQGSNRGGGGGNKQQNQQQPRPRSQSASPASAAAHRMKRSGSNQNINTTGNDNNNNNLNRNLGSSMDWNASVKDSAIKDDWLDGGNSVVSGSGTSITSPSRTKQSNAALSTLHKGGLSIVAPVNWLLIFRAEVQKALDECRCREMTLNECTETIQKLYQSKVIANEKAVRGVGEVACECACALL